MPWIKAKNGNVFDVEDVDHARKILREGEGAHQAFVSDPREGPADPWPPATADDETLDEGSTDEGSGTPEGTPSDSWTVPQLKAFAKAQGIDLAGERTKPGILAAILTAGEDDDQDDDESSDDE